MEKTFYTADQIRSIATNIFGLELIGPTYNSTYTFKRFFSEDGHTLFAKESMSQIKANAEKTYFLCNEFANEYGAN